MRRRTLVRQPWHVEDPQHLDVRYVWLSPAQARRLHELNYTDRAPSAGQTMRTDDKLTDWGLAKQGNARGQAYAEITARGMGWLACNLDRITQ